MQRAEEEEMVYQYTEDTGVQKLLKLTLEPLISSKDSWNRVLI
jgi:hypothetical protein